MRPTSASRTPAQVAKHVDRDQARLYELIWNRAVASQMESAELERTTVDIVGKAGARNLELRATGQVVKFDGFLTLYQEGHDEDDEDEESRRLPAMSEGELLEKQAINSAQHFTEPPPRYSEAALVKRMEELGIGRPSTYASILQVLQDRGYVRIDKKRLMPEDKGRVVVGFLESFFQRYVEYDFTANLEEQLDRISNSEIDWKKVLQDFWVDFIGAVNEIKDLRITQVLDALNDLLAPHIFPQRRGRQRPAQMPELRNRPPVAQGRPLRRLHRLLELSGMQFHPPDDTRRKRRDERHQGARRGSGRPVSKSRCAAAASGLICSSAKRRRKRTPKNPSAPDYPRVSRRTTSTWRRRSRCWRCRAKSACIRKTASRSLPASAASGPTSNTARPTPISIPTRTCSPSASTARSA